MLDRVARQDLLRCLCLCMRAFVCGKNKQLHFWDEHYNRPNEEMIRV